MWYFLAKFNIKSIHIVSCSGVLVNDLQLFYKKNTKMHKKWQRETDRYHKTDNYRSENYAVF